MNERNHEAMLTFLKDGQAACLGAQAALQQEGRADEAVFQRIRANVYELSQAVLNAAMKQQDPAGFFRLRMEQIPASWEIARQKAETHGDTVQAHLEQIKLSAAEEIRAAFNRIWSEEA